MKKIFYISILSIFTFIGCNDFENVVNITEVANPNLSEDAVVGQNNSAGILLAGIERQAAKVVNEFLIISELASDNYVNTQTYYNQLVDGLDFKTTDNDIRDLQFAIARLRELAKFGLEKVGPNDTKYSKSTKAEFLFFEGLSYLYAGMYFSYLPQEEKGKLFSSKQNYETAINRLTKAININGNNSYYLARARANYFLGNKTEAVSDAKKVIKSKALRAIAFDAKDGPSNVFESALYQRSTFDDLQPLPSLDFLDPKYSFFTTEKDPSVNILKEEEALLIIAEANISDANLISAKSYMKDLIDLIAERPIKVVDETVEQRTQAKPDSRPNKSTITVNGKTGLIIDRTAASMVPEISGTSITKDDVDTIKTEEEALNILYKMRQEVFIGEGIRFVDMGLKFVLTEEEIKLNPNIQEGGNGTVAIIPAFINTIKSDLDSFTYDKDKGTVTITNDVTKLLVDNRTSPLVLPFF